MINKINEIIDEKEQYQLKALRLEAENKRMKEAIADIEAHIGWFNYRNNNLSDASEVINNIKEIIEGVTDER